MLEESPNELLGGDRGRADGIRLRVAIAEGDVTVLQGEDGAFDPYARSESRRPRREKPGGHLVRKDARRVMRKPSKKLQRREDFDKPLMANTLTRFSTRCILRMERQETAFIWKPSNH